MTMKRTKTPWMKADDFDKPHGLRECHVVGPSLYVPSLAIGG